MATFEEQATKWFDDNFSTIDPIARKAVIRGYVAGAASRDEEVAELRSKIEAARVLIQRWRDMTNAEEYKLHREWAIDQNADELEAALGKPTNPVTDKPREPINWHIIDACQACSEHYGICEHHQKLYGDRFRSEPKPKSQHEERALFRVHFPPWISRVLSADRKKKSP